MRKLFHLTQTGVDEFKAELTHLTSQRAPLAESIKQARELGDLAENAEYQSAREEQARVEARISEIEHILQNVALIKKPRGAAKVQLGSTVKLQSKSGKAKAFQIVGTVEADPLNGKISDESPIGKALMGKNVGDFVEFKTPSETTNYKVVEIG